jgi:hypothetical protein
LHAASNTIELRPTCVIAHADFFLRSVGICVIVPSGVVLALMRRDRPSMISTR